MRHVLGQVVVLGALCGAGCSSAPGGASSGTDGGGGGGGGGGTGVVGTGGTGGTTPESGWSEVTRIGTPRSDFNVDIHGVDVDLNEAGTGIAVWDEADDDAMAGGIWVAWYRDGGWASPEEVTGVDAAAALPSVALNDGGDAVVAYQVVDSGASGVAVSQTVWAVRYTAGNWTAPERLSAAPSTPGELFAIEPRAGIDAQGHASVVWEQHEVSLAQPDRVFAVHFDGAGWGAPLPLSDETLRAADTDLAVSAAGTATAVWVQHTNPNAGQPGGGPSIPNVWARVFDGSAWGSAQRIGSNDLGDSDGCERPRVVADTTGRAFAIWEERRAAEHRVVAARLDPAGPSWSAAVSVAASTASADNLSVPSVATDGAGNCLAVWRADAAGGVAHGASARHGAGVWGAPDFFETGGDVASAVAVMVGTAEGWAVYEQVGALKARRHDAALGWQDVVSVGYGRVSDADANSSGMVLVGSYDAFASGGAFMIAAQAAVYVP